jgi:hypothetical protein
MLDELFGHWHRQVGHELAALASSEHWRISFQLAAGNRAGHERASDAAILEELARFERLFLGLVVHVLVAARGESQREHQEQE